jgi:chemotaxis protein histidine kinase CheA
MAQKAWWKHSQSLQEMVDARKAHYAEDSVRQLELLKNLKTKGLIPEHDYTRHLRRCKAKAMKYEWEGFISACHITNRLIEDIVEKRKELNAGLLEGMALLLECPRDCIVKVLGNPNIDNTGEALVEHNEAPDADEEETESEEETVEEENTEESESGEESGGYSDDESEAEEDSENETEEATETTDETPEVTEEEAPEDGEAETEEETAEEEDPMPEPKKRGPGRPKGSKNRGVAVVADEPTPAPKSVKAVAKPVVEKKALVIKPEPKKAVVAKPVAAPVKVVKAKVVLSPRAHIFAELSAAHKTLGKNYENLAALELT